jgi:hypothetical protein
VGVGGISYEVSLPRIHLSVVGPLVARFSLAPCQQCAKVKGEPDAKRKLSK